MAGIPKNYRYVELDQSRYYFDMYDNEKRNKTWMDILDEFRPKGAIGIMNLSYFSLSDGSLQSAVKIHGEWKKNPSWLSYGVCIDKNGRMYVDTYQSNPYSYTDACPSQYVNGEKSYNYTKFSTNGNTYIGFKPDGTICLMLCDKDNGQSSVNADTIMLDAGCNHIMRMDGSWSSHGQLGFNEICSPSEYRYDRLYLIIYDREAAMPRTKYKVTLDVYGDYSEDQHPLTWKIIRELQNEFTRQGIESMTSIYPDQFNLSSYLRAKQSNTWKADVCLSIDADFIDDDKAKVISSSAGETAGRNIMAGLIIEELKNAGFACNDTVTYNRSIIMLPNTNAKSNFIRYNDSLMETDYIMQSAVEATVKGVCRYLNVEYIEKESEDEDIEPTLFERYQNAGIIPDNVDPTDVLTYEELISILDKLGITPSSGTVDVID